MLRRVMAPWFVGLMCGAGLAAQAQDTLTFAADSWCPFNCPVAAKQPGFIVEIVRAVYEPLGYRVVYQIMPWSRALQEARQGKLTGVFSAPRSVETQGFIFPAESVGMMQNALFKKRTTTWKYTGLPSLDIASIGFVKGYVFPGEIGEYLARKAATAPNNVQLSTGETAGPRNILKLAAGRVDLIAEDVSVVAYERSVQKIPEEFEIAARIGKPVPIYVVFSPLNADAQGLADRMDAGIRRLRTSGQLQEILARYGLRDWLLK